MAVSLNREHKTQVFQLKHVTQLKILRDEFGLSVFLRTEIEYKRMKFITITI